MKIQYTPTFSLCTFSDIAVSDLFVEQKSGSLFIKIDMYTAVKVGNNLVIKNYYDLELVHEIKTIIVEY